MSLRTLQRELLNMTGSMAAILLLACHSLKPLLPAAVLGELKSDLLEETLPGRGLYT